MRYVRFQCGFVMSPRGDSVPTHHDISQPFQSQGRRPISAGFVDFSDGKVNCWGESVSLRLKSRPDDSAALAAQLGILL